MLLSPQLRLDHFKIPLADPGPGMASLSRRSEGSCAATRRRHASRRKLFTESLSWSRRVRFVGPSTPLLPPFPRHFPLFASPLFSLHFSTSHRPLASPLYLPSDLFMLAMYGDIPVRNNHSFLLYIIRDMLRSVVYKLIRVVHEGISRNLS